MGQFKLKHLNLLVIVSILFIILINIIVYADTFEENGDCVEVEQSTRDVDGIIGIFYPSYQRTDKEADWGKQGISQITVQFESGKIKKGTGIMLGQNSLVTSSLLIYDEAINKDGYKYPIIGNIKDITVKMQVDNKDYAYKVKEDKLFTSDIADKIIKNIDKENLDSDFEYGTELLSECYLVINLDDCIGLKTGFYPIIDFSNDDNKYIQVRADDGSLIESKVTHNSKRDNNCIIYAGDVSTENSLGAPALTLHTYEKEKAGYLIAGINQGKHKGKNVITTLSIRRDLFLSKGFFTSVPQDFKYSELVEYIDNEKVIYGTKGYNPTGKDLVLEGSFNYIDNDIKMEYPFSPICTVEPVFVTKKGNLGSYISTGQLVDNNKVLTCAHAFKFDAIELEKDLDKYDKNSNARGQQTFKISRDSLYEKELAKIERIEKYKKDNDVEEIVFEPDILMVERPYTIEEEYELRKKATKSNADRTPEEEEAFREKLRQSKPMLRDNLYEKELDKIERIRKEEERRKDLTLDEKFAWEFDNFYGIYIDFGYDTENDTESTDDIYKVAKENIFIHKDYLFGTEENDLACMIAQEKLGNTYGYFGLTSEIKDKELYSLTGYPEELAGGISKIVLKNMYLTSSTGSFDRNLGNYNDYLYYYDIVTAKGFSGSGLKSKSSTGNDYRVASIHYGKNSETGYPVGNKMTKEVIEWIQSIN